jgi:hypothetical protein
LATRTSTNARWLRVAAASRRLSSDIPVGLTTKSSVPASNASAWLTSSSLPVITTTCTAGPNMALSLRMTSRPLVPGISRSTIARSGGVSSAWASVRAPACAVTTW